VLAGLIVQRVSGERYERYIQDHLFAPLGMNQSTFDLQNGAELGMAQGYGHHRGRAVRLDPFVVRGMSPTGGVITTTTDASRYFRALLNGGSLDGMTVLSPGSVAQMWQPSFHASETTATGLGWDVSEVRGQKAVSWIGGAGTYGSIFMAMPERGLAVGVI